MKILQVTNFFKPSWESGGPARVAYEISKKLIEQGNDVTVYTTDGFKSRLDVEKNRPVDVDKIKTYYFKNLSSFLARKMVLPIPYYLPIVAREKVKDFDIIHIHEHRTILAIIVCSYAEKYGVPYILQAHGSVLPIYQRQKLKNLFDILFGFKILRNASNVLALTETEADQYKNMGVDKDKIKIVPNGIDLLKYKTLPPRGEFRKKYSIKDTESILLFVGRLHKTKGIELLVEAFADLLKEFDEVKLVLMGPDDGYKAILERMIQDQKIDRNVIFTGFVSNYDKMVAFVDADVFVTPSFLGFPVTFLEACACCTPIITTTKGDKLDWIHDKIGFVVEYDRDSLKNAIIKVLGDKRLKEKFGEEGRRLVEKEFNWEMIVKSIPYENISGYYK